MSTYVQSAQLRAWRTLRTPQALAGAVLPKTWPLLCAILKAKPAAAGRGGPRRSSGRLPPHPHSSCSRRTEDTLFPGTTAAPGLPSATLPPSPARVEQRLCHLLCMLVAHSCSTRCDPVDYSPPGSSVHRILQVRILKGLPFSSPGDLPDPGTEPRSPALQADSLPFEPPGKLSDAILGPSSVFGVSVLHTQTPLKPIGTKGLGITVALSFPSETWGRAGVETLRSSTHPEPLGKRQKRSQVLYRAQCGPNKALMWPSSGTLRKPNQAFH